MTDQSDYRITRTITALNLAEQEAYWLKALYGDLPVLDGLLDHPRPLMQIFLRASETIRLDTMLCANLHELRRQKEVQRYALLLTALQVVLARHTAQKSIIVGTLSPDSLRRTGEQQEQFTNPIALRTDVSDDPTIGDLLQRIVLTLASASENRDYPFELLINYLDNQQDHSRAPVFQVMFIDEYCGLSTTPISYQNLSATQDITTRCDLVFFVQEDGGALQVRCEYDASLFESATIRCLLEHFYSVLEQLEKGFSQRLSATQLLSDAERQRVIIEWNDTQAPYPQEACIHEFFERQARLTPDADAVACGNDRLTYRDLDRYAFQIALLLQKRGVGPDTLVGLFVDRSFEMVIGLLAILKAGGAYVPLDPSLPAHRLEMLLEDTQTPLIVTQPHLVPHLPQHSAQLICVDCAALSSEEGSTGDITGRVSADNLACVLYTSGSTGRPKGVMLSHRVLTNLLSWHEATLITGVRTLQFASLNFDQSIHEMFAAWASGGTLYILPEALRTDVAGLAEYLIDQQIEKIWLPVVLLQQLAEIYGAGTRLPLNLREVLATGEQLRITQPLRDLFTRLDGCTLANHYGPTESHLVTTYQLPDNTAAWPVLPPIGRPIANTHIYLVDERLHPVPIGLPGELCISGHCLARGYWGKPELTAKSFVPNPYATEVSSHTSRMYRTGDLARYLPNGDIEFLGRLDQQVKIRGMRVEPGEIEATLTDHPGVREAVVLLHAEAPDITYLVAYFVATEEASPTAAELRHFLEMRLPIYMVPSTFILLDKLPLNHNGKVNRQALPAPATMPATSENAFVGPRTQLEEKLVNIWSGLLRVKQVGIHDNFFALGGHSLLGAQLISQIRRELQVELTHFELFENPTISGIAENIESIRLAARLGQIASDERGEMREEIEM